MLQDPAGTGGETHTPTAAGTLRSSSTSGDTLPLVDSRASLPLQWAGCTARTTTGAALLKLSQALATRGTLHHGWHICTSPV